MLSRISACRRAVHPNVVSKVLRRHGGDHHGPMMPPFARSGPPTGRLPTEVELVWDDSVAPETCIDFDAPHVSVAEALTGVGLIAAFFATVFFTIKSSDPEGRNPVATRSAVLPPDILVSMGYAVGGSEDAEEEEEDE